MNKKILASLLGLTFMSMSISGVHAANQDIDFSKLTVEQKTQLGKVVEQYMIENPEILIKVSNALQEAEALRIKNQVMAIKTDILNDKNTAIVKGKDSKVTIVEFFDYNCIHCSGVYPEVKKLMEAKNNSDVNFAFKEYPIFADKMKESKIAAATGLKILNTKGIDAYMIFHNGIFDTKHVKGELTIKDIEDNAKKAGSEIVSDEEIKTYEAMIEKNMSLQAPIGIQGTPFFLILPENGKAENIQFVGGAAKAEQIQQVLDSVKAKS